MLHASESNTLTETWFAECSCIVNKDYSVTFPSCTGEFFKNKSRVSFTMNFIAKSISVCKPVIPASGFVKGPVTVPVEKLPNGEFKIHLPAGLVQRMRDKTKVNIKPGDAYDISSDEDDAGDMVGDILHLAYY